MKINKFKAISLVVCFFIGLCLGSQGMDDYFDSDKLENPYVSWGSYLMSPVKATIQMANFITNYVVANPKKSIFIGVNIACKMSIATTQHYACTCLFGIPGHKGTLVYYDNYTNIDVCNINCKALLCPESIVIYHGQILNFIMSECFIPC